MSKILVVEDDDIIRRNITEILRIYHFDSITAENGKVALEVLSKEQPDLILCDVMMPEMTGHELLKQLSGMENLKTIPFLFLSAKTDLTDIRQGMNLGADDYITKPVVHGDLIKAIETRLKKAKAQAEKTLDDFLAEAAEGIHILGRDGHILWANDMEIQLLGYAPSEYIGHSVTEFHRDQEIIQDVLKKLKSGERITNYPVLLKAKDGSLRHVLINSNGFFKDGNFSHTRCFTRDVTGLFDLTDMVEAQLKKLKAG